MLFFDSAQSRRGLRFVRCRGLGMDSISEVGSNVRGIEDRSVDRRQFVNVAVFEVEEKRCNLAERTSDVPVVLRGVVRLLRAGEGIGRVESRVVANYENLPVVFVGSGLGEDFDAAVSELVVLGGERVLVNADFANGRFGRELTGGEAVDVHLLTPLGPTDGPTSRAYRSDQQQFIGIVEAELPGSLPEITIAPALFRRIHVDGRRSVGDLNLLSLDFDRHRHIQPKGLVRDHRFVILVESESPEQRR